MTFVSKKKREEITSQRRDYDHELMASNQAEIEQSHKQKTPPSSGILLVGGAPMSRQRSSRPLRHSPSFLAPLPNSACNPDKSDHKIPLIMSLLPSQAIHDP